MFWETVKGFVLDYFARRHIDFSNKIQVISCLKMDKAVVLFCFCFLAVRLSQPIVYLLLLTVSGPLSIFLFDYIIH